MAANYAPQSRKKWRKLDYYMEGTEHIMRLPGGITRRTDLHGFCDILAVPVGRPHEPRLYIQMTAWKSISTRLRKIQREETGKGQWAVPIADLARDVLLRGDRIIIEGWRQGTNGRYECKEREVTLEDLECTT